MIPIPGRLAGAILLFLAVTISWTCAQNPTLPTIPAGNFNVTTYGAVGDGVTTNTTAIQNAINAASMAGGGTVEIPASANAYLSGPLTLANNINLQVDSGAILRMLPYLVYPNTSPLITASSLNNIEISGSGTIDGQSTFASWWTNNPSLSTSQRPILVSFNSCKIVLVQNITLENPPSMHMVFKGTDANITVQGITINSPGNSPNTDGIDLIGTNVVVKNCSISAGDDCIALGSTGGTSFDTMVTNCAFGTGHGMSVGSNTSGGVSNLVVVNCTFNGTEYGLRLKSDTNSTSGGEGGITQNLLYENLVMSNISEAPIVIYSYYNEVGTPTSVKPSTAAGEPVIPVLPTTCIWRNIVFSNIKSTVGFPATAGILWGRTELPMTNILFYNVDIANALGPFDVYNAKNVRFINSQVSLFFSGQQFLLFNGGLTFSNTLPASETTNESMGAYITNSTIPFALYNASASTTNPDMFAASPISISGGTLTVSNNFTVPNSDVFNFALGTNTSTVAVGGNLTFNNTTINITNALGFGAGTYTLFSYTGSEAGTYSLGVMPTNNFNYALTNTSGQIQFIVSSTGPSLTPVTVLYTNSGGQLQLSWPQDHTGWLVQIQTNSLSKGLSTNWTTIAASSGTNVFSLPVNPANGSVFLRLIYP
jgi:polygalacturonase